MKQRVADFIADFLAANNITDIFTVTGGGAMHLNDAFGNHPKLHCTCNPHDVLWDEHPLYCGRPGTIGNRGGNFVAQKRDLLLIRRACLCRCQ